MEKANALKFPEDVIRKNFYILSAMLTPALDTTWIKIAQICDQRQMALLAAEVMAYRKQHGKLPQDLSFLPQVPLAELDHTPFMYEKTQEGFRIFSRTDKGEKPDVKDTAYSFQVRL